MGGGRGGNSHLAAPLRARVLLSARPAFELRGRVMPFIHMCWLCCVACAGRESEEFPGPPKDKHGLLDESGSHKLVRRRCVVVGPTASVPTYFLVAERAMRGTLQKGCVR